MPEAFAVIPNLRSPTKPRPKAARAFLKKQKQHFLNHEKHETHEKNMKRQKRGGWPVLAQRQVGWFPARYAKPCCWATRSKLR
jgi:hypothetical protein